MGIWGTILLGIAVAYFAHDLPSISEADLGQRRPAITILAADGTVLRRYGDVQAGIVHVDELPQHLIDAVLATEDDRFYWHPGIDPIGLTRAMVANYQAGRIVQGGSTITQQLAKNLFLTPDRTYKRKIQEALLAIWLEWKFDKDRLLTAYLNRVYLGSGTYGVEAAAQEYFNRSARELTLHQSAMIAGMLKAPSRYNPKSNPDLARDRAATVLRLMVDRGRLDPAQINQDRGMDLVTGPSTRAEIDPSTSYFTDFVADSLDDVLGPVDRDVIVETTLEVPAQELSRQALQQVLAQQGQDRQVEQGAVVILRPDGSIIALVGGRDYRRTQFNRATQAQRQPGSAFKPFVFLAALEAGWDTDSPVTDGPVTLGDWSPRNFNDRYRGVISLTEALAQSSNTVAARLANQVGARAIGATAEALGTGRVPANDLSIALGTQPMTPLELTTAYAGLASGGRAVFPYAIRRITDRQGRILFERLHQPGPRVAGAGLVSKLDHMLRAVVTRGTGRHARLSVPVAGKTGTSQNYRDAWFVGYTPRYVATVWLGNDDNSPTGRVTGGSLPAQTWARIIGGLHSGRVSLSGGGGGFNGPVPAPPRRPRGVPAHQPGRVTVYPVSDPNAGSLDELDGLIRRLNAEGN